MKNKINVLSLFDGMSCGRIALERAGIRVDNYYASEIDKYAITVSQKNYHDVKQLGDVTQWRTWNIDWSNIDLLIAGSPCQGFSFAGKQLAFDDPRSKLFFVFVDILNHIRELNPDVKFLLENVRMKKEHLQVISDTLKVEPLMINSALVSAQNRIRYYWTNWYFDQPEDKGILLKDIVEQGLPLREKSQTVLSTMYKENVKSMIKRKKHGLLIKEFNTPPSGRGMNRWVYSKIGFGEGWFRKLTTLECERLQTLPKNYTEGVSKTRRCIMLGNGWTIDVIVHILKHL